MFNKETSNQIPQLLNGKFSSQILNSLQKQLHFFKNVAVNADLFSSPDDLEVKDEVI